MRRIIAVVFLLSLASAPAAAQIVTPLDPSETYVPVLQSGTGPTVCFSDGFCITEGRGIPITALATTTQLNALGARVDELFATFGSLGAQLSAFDARLAAIGTDLNNALMSIDNRLATFEGDIEKAFELAAVAAALKDAVPNNGDRFAIRLNAAGVGGEFAGAIGLSANVSERARVLVNYGRSGSHNAVSGGVNLSFP